LIERYRSYNGWVRTLIQAVQKNNSSLTDAQIEGIFYILLNNPGIPNNGLIRETGIPKETLRAFKGSISGMLQDSEGDFLALNEESLNKLVTLKPRPYKWSLITYGNAELIEKLEQLRKKYSLEPKRELDQFFATAQTSVSKAMVMLEKGHLERKNIALMGDDDLVSVVIGMMNVPEVSVTVFDVDPSILETISTITTELSIKNVRTVQMDVRNGISNNYKHTFDVAVTDPPYTRNGVESFVNACLDLLKKNAYIYLYYGNSFKAPEKTLKIQDVLNGFNLVIEDRIDRFARYYGAESIGSASSLYILKTTLYTAPKSLQTLPDTIYTFEDQSEEKFPYVDHFTFKINKIPNNIMSQRKAQLKLIDEFCRAHKLKIVDTKITQFRNKGFSYTIILSTSNLLVHTWPEYQAIHIDLITCSPIYNKESLAETLSKLFQTKSIEARKVE
jgi:S-adenosylmethionine/arginine decarboxylase-like enzyme/predicted RNA methylase